MCLTAVIGGLLALRYRAALPHRLLAAWIAVVTLGAFYFGGEELSCGQHLAGWDTPETLGAFNDQNETNIHNISSWFDQKPRLALELWVLFGGVIYGLRRWISPGTAPPPGDWRHWFWPTATCVPVSVLAIVVRLGERLKDWFGMPIPPAIEIRASETQEYCFALFLVIYLWSLHVRLRTRANADR